MLNPYTLNIQESLKHAWHWGICIFRCLAAKVLSNIGVKVVFRKNVSAEYSLFWLKTLEKVVSFQSWIVIPFKCHMK